MGEFNTIVFKRGEARLSNDEYKKFEKGDTIWGDGSYPDELKRWNIEDKEEAEKMLAKCRSSYSLGSNGNIWYIEEYALEYCEYDESGEFVCGSDFDLADEEEGVRLAKFLEENYGDLTEFPEQKLEVDECAFVNDKMFFERVNVVGDSECFDGDEFYQYVLAGDKLYKAYFSTTDEDGNSLDLDSLDYKHAYKIVDVTQDILDMMDEI